MYVRQGRGTGVPKEQTGCGGRADPRGSEVSFITRQQFMTELSKLLTFMYDEDRQRALKMYERMFDIAEDDQGLIQHLMSPTRQAVVIARAYDAKERKLSVSAQKKGDGAEDGDDIPPFVLAINRIFDELFPEEDPEQGQAEDQVSFFDLGVDPGKPEVKKPVVPKAEVLLSDTQNFQIILPSDRPEEGEAQSPETEDENPAERGEEETGGETPNALSAEERAEAAADWAGRPSGSDREVPILSFTFDEEEQEEPAADSEEAGQTADASEETAEPAEAAEESAPAQDEAPEEEKKDLVQTVQELFPEEKTETVARQTEEPAEESPRKRRRTVPMERVTDVPRLILFVIAAIPVTLLLLALLLIPTLLSLSVAIGMIALGVTLILAAFSGFAVLADVLMLFGASLIALALGLVFLWITIWLIGEVMVGLVRSVIELGRKWCSKEVPAI
jgi:hypothetical protein